MQITRSVILGLSATPTSQTCGDCGRRFGVAAWVAVPVRQPGVDVCACDQRRKLFLYTDKNVPTQMLKLHVFAV